MPAEPPRTGLRERKKIRTRAEIQRAALRLFREQGYEETAVAQIAEAAEVSESTFFRYFPTKEDVVLWDEFDPLIFQAYRAQPPTSSPIQALRAASREVLDHLPDEVQAAMRERTALMLSAAPLRARLIDETAGPLRMLAGLFAERIGRDPADTGVRALAGAVLGLGLAAMFAAAEDPTVDLVEMLDESLARLESGHW